MVTVTPWEEAHSSLNARSGLHSASAERWVIQHSSRLPTAGLRCGTRLIATNLLEPPAQTLALVYRKRWTVELFFRFFKHTLGCRHLLSHRKNGIEIQVYAAIIVCMLIALWTGRKPTRRTVVLIAFYFTGWADEEELEAHIAKLQSIES